MFQLCYDLKKGDLELGDILNVKNLTKVTLILLDVCLAGCESVTCETTFFLFAVMFVRGHS